MKKLVYLPTAQHSTPWRPNSIGQARIAAAVTFMKSEEGRDAVLMIEGGYHNHAGFSYAEIMAAEIRDVEIRSRIKLVFGSQKANRTVRGIYFSMPLLQHYWSHEPHETEVYFASELPHYLRVVPAFEALGYIPKHLDSKADAGKLYSDADKAMQKPAYSDLFGLGPSAQEWNRKADEKVAEYVAWCKQWQNENPEQNKMEMDRIQKAVSALQS